MNKSATCSACVFFDEHSRNAAAPSDGLCRYNPPVSQPNETSHGLWPVVTQADWCGHFTADRSA
ncbi:hypothetical protein GCM10007276_07920 [Agaricicola taiwanensis]|uniref:Uncharacterized protein n=1 Tax=Agaricicola taiwanensis TaxID=591372 RepID=A0A8J2YG70_9RHOB|nr:hypothetical protein [Agaricicola taiwanensis]GGE33078.1 hypothetical protein GCM10007276_07920 [Agaricicola taiwanensis]